MPGSSLILIHSFISQDDPSLDVHCVRDKKYHIDAALSSDPIKDIYASALNVVAQNKQHFFCRNVLFPIWGFFRHQIYHH